MGNETKIIEELTKRIYGYVKNLEELSKRLEGYDHNAVGEVQEILPKLREEIEKLNEALKNLPEIPTPTDLKARYEVKKTMDYVDKVYAKLNEAYYKFKEGLSNPYVRRMIEYRMMVEEMKFGIFRRRICDITGNDVYVGFYGDVPSRRPQSFFAENPQERIPSEGSDKDKQVKAEVGNEKNPETPDKPKKRKAKIRL